MAVLFELTRRPRTRLTPPIIQRELKIAYQKLGKDLDKDLKEEAKRRGYKGIVPTITVGVYISGNIYRVQAKIDRRTKAGQIFWWVDQGTMDKGDPATTYPIDAVNAPNLVFDVPYQPQTYPDDGVLNYDPGGEPMTIRTQHVDHPGIKPRLISQVVLVLYNSRTYRKGFYRTTENAYRRGFRRARAAGAL